MSDDFVSREELSAHLDPMREDIREIKGDVKSLLASRYTESFFGGRGHALLTGLIPAVIAALVAGLISLSIAYL